MMDPQSHDVEALTNLNNSLKLLQQFKLSLHSLFDSVANGPTDGQDNQNYLLGIQQKLISMDTAFTDLENSGNSLPNHNPQQVNSMLVALEPENDNYEVFHQLSNSYAWNRKMQDYSGLVNNTLKDNQLKRAGPVTGFSAKRTKKSYPDVHNVSPQNVNQVIQRLHTFLVQKHPDMTMDIHRPVGNSTLLVVSVAKVLKVVVVMRGLLMERVIVKGYGESTYLDNGQVDIWGKSKYKVFQQVNQSAHSALLHLHSPIHPESVIYFFMQWLQTYSNMFADECHYCRRLLQNYLPPTGRSCDKFFHRFHPQCLSSQSK